MLFTKKYLVVFIVFSLLSSVTFAADGEEENSSSSSKVNTLVPVYSLLLLENTEDSITEVDEETDFEPVDWTDETH